MFPNALPLFRLAGFSVRVDWSWLILFVLITWSLAAQVFPDPRFFPGLSPAVYLAMGIAGSLGLFLSIVLHELGHSLVARGYGVEMRGITLFIFGGVAEMGDEPPSAVAEFWIAVAGPITSVMISVGCFLLGFVGGWAGLPGPVTGVLFYLALINAVLVAFNMVPAFPLDGGRVLRAILWSYKDDLRWATRVTSSFGAAFGIVLIVMGVFSFIGGNFIGGVWWFILGLFLRGAAQMSYQQVLVRRALEGERLSRFMRTDAATVPSSVDLRRFVDDYVYRHHYKMFPVIDNGHLRGCITTRKIKEIPAEEWPMHTVSELTDPCSDENTIDLRADATDALAKMSKTGNSRLMVVEDGELRGIVALKDMLHFISLKADLEES